jgi:hypothetical protein
VPSLAFRTVVTRSPRKPHTPHCRALACTEVDFISFGRNNQIALSYVIGLIHLSVRLRLALHFRDQIYRKIAANQRFNHYELDNMIR